MTHICPVCETGTLAARVSDRTIRFEGHQIRIQNLHYSECPVCGEKVVLPAQSKRNEIAYADAKKAHLDLWSCGKIESFRKQWQLTQNTASKLFGGGANAFSKYERGEVIHTKAMDLLMRVFDQSEEARVLLGEFADITLPNTPAWETIRSAPAPKRHVNANAVMRGYEAVKHQAANGDHWETYEVAYGQ